MGGIVDDFDDDLTVPAQPGGWSQAPAVPGDDFDGDFTAVAVPIQPSVEQATSKSPAIDLTQDDFDDDLTVHAVTQRASPTAAPSASQPASQPIVRRPARPAFVQPETPRELLQQRGTSLPVPPPSSTPWTPPKRPTSPPSPVSRQKKRSRTAAVASVLLALVVVLVVLWFLVL